MPMGNNGDELVLVYSTESFSDAALAKGRLESEGIPVLTKGEGEGPYPAGASYLFVPVSFEEAARAILKEEPDEADNR